MFNFAELLLLPLGVEVVVDLLVGDGHHDDEDPEQHHAHQELVDHPHGHHGRLQVLRALPPRDDTLQQVVTGHLRGRVHLIHGKKIFENFKNIFLHPSVIKWKL